jgi:hypothetical protein
MTDAARPFDRRSRRVEKCDGKSTVGGLTGNPSVANFTVLRSCDSRIEPTADDRTLARAGFAKARTPIVELHRITSTNQPFTSIQMQIKKKPLL